MCAAVWKLTFGNTCSTVRAGDYFVVDYGVPHGYRQIDDKPCEIINACFCRS